MSECLATGFGGCGGQAGGADEIVAAAADRGVTSAEVVLEVGELLGFLGGLIRWET